MAASTRSPSLSLSRRRLLRRSALGLLLPLSSALTGCGSVTLRHFGLRPLAPEAAQGPDLTLAVLLPEALQSLDSTRIAYQPAPRELQSLAGADWVDRAPVMLQLLIVRSLQNRSRLRVSGGGQPGSLAMFQLSLILQDFQAERDGAGLTVHVTLVATLTRSLPRQALAATVCETRVAAGSGGIEDIVLAFEMATQQVVRQLIDWCLATISA